MRAIRWTSLPVALLVLASGCAPADDEGMDEMDTMADQEAEMSAADLSAAMDQMRMDWVDAANADDAAAVAEMYAPDAIFVDFYGQEHRGRDAILTYLEESFARGSGLAVTETWGQAAGDAYVQVGTWSQTVAGPDGDMEMEGVYHVTSRMMDDGTARILAHTSTVPQPMPEGM